MSDTLHDPFDAEEADDLEDDAEADDDGADDGDGSKLEAPPAYHYGRPQIDFNDATELPEALPVIEPEEVADTMFATSGGMDTVNYQPATVHRTLDTMSWPEAVVACRRLLSAASSYKGTTLDYVRLAEFSLAVEHLMAGEARDKDRRAFLGPKGDNTGKLRDNLSGARVVMHKPLADNLGRAKSARQTFDHPIMRCMSHMWKANAVLGVAIPMPDGRFVRVNHMRGHQVIAGLAHIRSMVAEHERDAVFARDVDARLMAGEPVTSQDYATALNTAVALCFYATKLEAFYRAIMHSMPVYRLHPATSEAEAIEAWWPWGRAVPLIDGGPAKPPRTRKKLLDPALITANRPDEVVKQVMALAGTNRITAQRMSKALRDRMRHDRKAKAVALLREGKSRAAIAKELNLSASLISKLLKGERTKQEMTRLERARAELSAAYEAEHVSKR
jgi:hypothetical protein